MALHISPRRTQPVGAHPHGLLAGQFRLRLAQRFLAAGQIGDIHDNAGDPAAGPVATTLQLRPAQVDDPLVTVRTDNATAIGNGWGVGLDDRLNDGSNPLPVLRMNQLHELLVRRHHRAHLKPKDAKQVVAPEIRLIAEPILVRTDARHLLHLGNDRLVMAQPLRLTAALGDVLRHGDDADHLTGLIAHRYHEYFQFHARPFGNVADILASKRLLEASDDPVARRRRQDLGDAAANHVFRPKPHLGVHRPVGQDVPVVAIEDVDRAIGEVVANVR